MMLLWVLIVLNLRTLIILKTALVGKTKKHDAAKGESYVENTKIVFPMKYLSTFGDH